MVKIEEGRKDLGGKVSIFLVEQSSLVVMRMQGGKSSCVLLPAKRYRQMPTAELMNWNGRELPISNGCNASSLLCCLSWQWNFIVLAKSSFIYLVPIMAESSPCSLL